ncbi:Prephenate dehydratase-domain-containing protein [Apodospora peruviana]|uniref:prephenate dehydratase n=1 Tax=Apodospora peruviana TaxID=516989 RepID=A0AAE0LZK1_9PEZI|nr:Prephenate dehydratase-domain-containing protein [Apodospora peruviana]
MAGTSTTAAAKTVAFLGPPSSYTHQTTKRTFSESEWELKPTVTIRDVFDAVQAGAAAFGVVPFENSTHGVVTFTLDCLADRGDSQRYADLAVCGEAYLDVHHFLLGRFPSSSAASTEDVDGGNGKGDGTSTPTKGNPVPIPPRAKPLVSLKHIQRVYSHPQAFGQSGAFLRTYLKGVDLVDVTSTSKAAELAAADETGTSAAIAGEISAELKGLDVLARSIEDREDNTTRFFVTKKLDQDGSGPDFDGIRLGGEEQDERGEEGYQGAKYKSLVSFTVPHRTPGALADVLDCFRRGKLNLTSINSLPSLIEPFQYMFFVEFEGCRFDDPDGRVKGVMEDVGRVAQGWKWLGSWRNQRRALAGKVISGERNTLS